MIKMKAPEQVAREQYMANTYAAPFSGAPGAAFTGDCGGMMDPAAILAIREILLRISGRGWVQITLLHRRWHSITKDMHKIGHLGLLGVKCCQLVVRG